jgi:outer membrane protein assembly factor BamB
LNATTGFMLWKRGDVAGSPSVVGGLVYVGGREEDVSYLFALNASDGGEEWRYMGAVGSSPAVIENVVYVGLSSDFYALDANTGDKVWNSSIFYGYSSPTVVDGVVYFGAEDGAVHALNATDGGDLWSFQTGSGVRSSPAVVDGMVFVGSLDGHLYAIVANPPSSPELPEWLLPLLMPVLVVAAVAVLILIRRTRAKRS